MDISLLTFHGFRATMARRIAGSNRWKWKGMRRLMILVPGEEGTDTDREERLGVRLIARTREFWSVIELIRRPLEPCSERHWHDIFQGRYVSRYESDLGDSRSLRSQTSSGDYEFGKHVATHIFAFRMDPLNRESTDSFLLRRAIELCIDEFEAVLRSRRFRLRNIHPTRSKRTGQIQTRRFSSR